MRHDTRPTSGLRSRTAARFAARRDRRALELYLSDNATSPTARRELEVIIARHDGLVH
jgi:hypothetical protein